MSYLQRLSWYTWGYAAAGVAFAGMVLNPNFTMRRSYYLRKLNPLMCGAIGYQWGHKRESDETVNLMLRMWDYFPFEVRRAVQTKDFRYLQMFDYKTEGAVSFDPTTGKSLT